MSQYSATANFAVDVVGPVILLIGFGYFLFKKRYVNDAFVETGSNLIFTFALPALLFINIAQADINQLLDVKSISVGIGATLITFVLAMILVKFFVLSTNDRGVIVQGIFRGNMGIIGLAYCVKAYGSDGLAFASVYMGCLTIVYNVLGVIVLSLYQSQTTEYKKIFKSILSNPIILSILVGILVSMLQVSLPTIVSSSIQYFAQLTLPLALICTGAALRFSSFGQYWRLTSMAIVGKCIFYPLLCVGLALFIDLEGMALGVIFLMATSPTAAASYIMVKKIGGNHQLAAQIVALSTVVSLPLTAIGFLFLSQVADLQM